MKQDFSDYTSLVPAKTVVILQGKIRYGDGEDNVLKRTKAGDGEGLDMEFTLLDGPYAREKFFAFMLVKGETPGQNAMAKSNLERLKLIQDSALYLDPGDKSPEARAKRSFAWRDFDGIRFLAEVGVEEGRSGFPDKNVITRVITKDQPLWGGRPPIDQTGPDRGLNAAPVAPVPSTPAAAPIVKPAGLRDECAGRSQRRFPRIATDGCGRRPPHPSPRRRRSSASTAHFAFIRRSVG
jgi:hypothetical protein